MYDDGDRLARIDAPGKAQILVVGQQWDDEPALDQVHFLGKSDNWVQVTEDSGQAVEAALKEGKTLSVDEVVKLGNESITKWAAAEPDN